MASLELLRSFNFGNEAGEDIAPSELAQYFVEQSVANDFLDHSFKFLLATGKKGVGKSSLTQWASYKLPKRRRDILVVKVRGAELSGAKKLAQKN